MLFRSVLALPIFALVMFTMYAIAMGSFPFSIGTIGTDWANDVLFGEWIPGVLDSVLTALGVSGWLYGLVMDGILAGVGAVLGFVPQILVLSFLLSIPAILGANILSLKDAVEAGIIWADVPVYLVGVVVSAVVGYACIRLLKMIADRGKFGAFAYYCWAVGVLTLILTFIQK